MSKVEMNGAKFLSGRLGNLIYYQSCGRQLVRSYPQSFNDRCSLAQLKQRKRLAYISQLAIVFSPALVLGYRQTGNCYTPYNRFVSENIKQVECSMIENQPTMSQPVVHCSIDPRHILCSIGTLPNQQVEVRYVAGSHKLVVNYMPLSLLPCRVEGVLVIYQPGLPRVFIVNVGPLELVHEEPILLPDSFRYGDFHVYSFCTTPDGSNCSTSSYVVL